MNFLSKKESSLFTYLRKELRRSRIRSLYISLVSNSPSFSLFQFIDFVPISLDILQPKFGFSLPNH